MTLAHGANVGITPAGYRAGMVADRTARAEWIWGGPIEGGPPDLSHGAERDAFIRAAVERQSVSNPLQIAVRQSIAAQVLTDDPPDVWRTAQRLAELGISTAAALDMMSFAFLGGLVGDDDTASADHDHDHDHDPGHDHDRHAGYVRRLDALPIPSPSEIADALIEVVASSPWIGWDDATTQAVSLLNHGDEFNDGVLGQIAGSVLDQLIDPDGPLAVCAGDALVHVPRRLLDSVLTCRVDQAAIDADALAGAFDLAPLRYWGDSLRAADGEHVHTEVGEWGSLGLWLPEGSLAGCEPGDIVAVRVTEDDVVHVERAEPSDPDPALIEAVRSGFAAERAATDLPVSGDELVLATLRERAGSFAAPQPPLSELAEAAGLTVRGAQCAETEQEWRNARRVRSTARLLDRLDDEAAHQVAPIITLIEVADGWDAGLDTPATAAEALRVLRDPELVSAVADAIVESPDPSLPAPDPEPFLGLLHEAARRGVDRATVGWLRAIVTERDGRLDEAERLLAAAHIDDPEMPHVIDRLAWYASDRGDARRASMMWRLLDADDVVAADARVVDAASDDPGRSLGRNDRCWCGSGRKFKQCHLGTSELPPLPARMDWMWRKAHAYLDRRGGDPRVDMFDLAVELCDDPTDERSLDAALDDPLTLDLVLVEGGWFARFLEERGALLPPDELALMHTWADVSRTVYEMLDAPDGGAAVLDLATTTSIELSAAGAPRGAAAGELWCGRVVSDGDGHRFVGAPFRIEPDEVSELTEALSIGDPFAVAAWMADRPLG